MKEGVLNNIVDIYIVNNNNNKVNNNKVISIIVKAVSKNLGLDWSERSFIFVLVDGLQQQFSMQNLFVAFLQNL